MLSAYAACFFKDDSGYSVVFPDLNYLSTCGSTLDEALSMSVDCLAGYLFGLEKDGEAAPPASKQIDLDAVASELDISSDGAFVNVITVDVSEYARVHFEKSVKKTLSIPASPKTWSDIEETVPDEFDLFLLKEIENNPECQEFVSQDEALKELGLS